MTTTSEIADALADDASYTLPDGRILRLRIEPDEQDPIHSFGEGWVYGRAQWVERQETYADGPEASRWKFPRPDGFDGNAEILMRHARAALWWQPYVEDGDVRRGTPAFAEYRQQVYDLFEFGFNQIGVELLDGTDAYGRPIVTRCAWLAGVDPFPDRDYVRSIVVDLLSEEDFGLAPEPAEIGG
jgi:hypothetical protein